MFFRNQVSIKGKLLRVKEINENFVLLTIMTAGHSSSQKNFPKLRVARKMYETANVAAGDYVTVSAKLVERTIRNFEDGTSRTVTGLKVMSLNKTKSLSEELGLPVSDNDRGFYDYENEIVCVGIVNYIRTLANGYKIVSLSLPEKASFIDFRKIDNYKNIKQGDIVCLKAVVQTKNRNKLTAEENTETDVATVNELNETSAEAVTERTNVYRNMESFAISNLEKVDVNFDNLLR